MMSGIYSADSLRSKQDRDTRRGLSFVSIEKDSGIIEVTSRDEATEDTHGTLLR
jgi:hypothetical protein